MQITEAKFKEDPNIFIKNVIKTGNPNPIPYITSPAIGTNSWKKFLLLFPCNVLVKLPVADIIKINDEYIQIGPYKSGLSLTKF